MSGGDTTSTHHCIRHSSEVGVAVPVLDLSDVVNVLGLSGAALEEFGGSIARRTPRSHLGPPGAPMEMLFVHEKLFSSRA